MGWDGIRGDGIDRWWVLCSVCATQYLHILSSLNVWAYKFHLLCSTRPLKVCGLECPLREGQGTALEKKGRTAGGPIWQFRFASFARSFVQQSILSILGWSNNAVKRGSYAVRPPLAIGSRWTLFAGAVNCWSVSGPRRAGEVFLDMPHTCPSIHPWHPDPGGIEERGGKGERKGGRVRTGGSVGG